MICSSCSHENPEQAKFCSQCGTPLSLTCNACGVELPAGAKFCVECGTAVATSPSPPTTTAVRQTSSPASYTPKHLAEKIINSRSAIEGERKQVTVMFADLKGSMELIADLDPEEAQRILDPVINLMMEAVHYYEGTVSLVLGDGLMAIFGAPVAHEDHAVRACYTALRIQESAAKLAEDLRRRIGIELNVRIGLNSGDVVVRSVGTDLRMDYSAIGHTTHLASRLEQLAESGSILMGPSTMRLVEGYVTSKSGGERDVKGLGEPLEVFEVLGATAVRSRLQAAVERGLTAFLGRDTELELLRQSLTRVEEEHGQIIAVSGEAGIGKSRLIWEFIHSQQFQGCRVLEGAPAAFGKTTSYGPIIDMMRRYFEIENLQAPGEIREMITKKVLELDQALVAFLPALLSLLGIMKDDPEWLQLDPQTQKRRLQDGFRHLFLMESKKQPLILLVDDLHWIDDETQALLDSIVDHLPTSPMLLLVGYRPEYEHNWSRKSYFREVRIAPLPTSSTKHLLEVLLGNDPSLPPLKRMLIERTDGNPFFVEESVRTLIEMKFIGGETGAYKLLKAADSILIPESAKAILSARIDRLSETDKRVLQAAAVIGKEVPFPLLVQIADVSEEELREALDHLQSLEFLYETSLFPELKYTFRHALVQEVSYGSLLGNRRTGLHRAIVDTQEATGSEQSLEFLDQIAHHGYRGELWNKATLYSRLAGKAAIENAALSEAVNCFEHSFKSLKRMDPGTETGELEIDTRFDTRAALIPLGQIEKAKGHLQTALAKAVELEDLKRQGLANCFLCNTYWELGEQDQAIEAGLLAQEIGKQLVDDKILNSAQRYLARAYQAVGDYPLAIKYFAESLPNHGEVSPSHILIRAFLLICRGEIGEFDEAVTYGMETVELAAATDNIIAHSAALSALGRVYVRRGEFEKAVPLLEDALSRAEVAGIALLYPFTAAPLGAAYARLNRLDDALDMLEQSIEKAVAMNRMVDASLWRYWQAQAFLLSGDVVAAKQAAERGLAFSITYKERGNQAGLLRLLGDIQTLTENSDPVATETNYREALEIAQELQMKPLVARCHIGLGRFHEKNNQPDQAKPSLQLARTMCDDLGATFWLTDPLHQSAASA